MLNSGRHLLLASEPGSGKSEVIVHAACAATIHSGFAIQRQYDKLVDYAPPSRLRRYDLILVDEASQIEDQVTRLLLMGIQELPPEVYIYWKQRRVCW